MFIPREIIVNDLKGIKRDHNLGVFSGFWHEESILSPPPQQEENSQMIVLGKK